MYGFSILMLIFSISILLVGLLIYTGHNPNKIMYQAQYKNLKKKDLKKLGKYTMITSIIPLLLSIIGFIFKF